MAIEAKQVLGHITCPTCGTAQAMRITHDKNGEPFGFCQKSCGQQLRIGGNAQRVARFVEAHPWAAKPEPEAKPEPAKAKAQPVPEAKPEPKPVQVTEKKKQPAGIFDGLRALGGKRMTNETMQEQAQDLAALEAAAVGDEQATQPEGEQAQGPDLANELKGLIAVAVATLSPIFPSLKEIYTDQATSTAAQAIAGVCNKHGWLGGGMFGKWGEEIAAVAVLAPLALATYTGVKGDLAKAKAAQNVEKLDGPNFEAKAPTEKVKSPTTLVFGNAPAPEAAQA